MLMLTLIALTLAGPRQALAPGRLFVSHMGAGQLVVFDVRAGRVIQNLDGFPTVTGVHLAFRFAARGSTAGRLLLRPDRWGPRGPLDCAISFRRAESAERPRPGRQRPYRLPIPGRGRTVAELHGWQRLGEVQGCFEAC